jgi:hypothetical protein
MRTDSRPNRSIANGGRHNPIRRGALCSESELADAWQERRYADEWLIDSTNRRLRVVFAGRRWGGPGPDFRGALLALADGRLVRGDIEIHRCARDWTEHGHARDPAYANVVLHVVRVLDGPSVDAHQQPIPTVALVPQHGPPALAHPIEVPCARDPAEVLEAVSRAGRARFHARAARFEGDLSVAEPDQVMWRGLAEALGFTRNTQAFGRLAEAVPWAEATRVAAERGPVGLAGLLLGVAGLINQATLPEAHAWRVLQRRLALRVALDSASWDRRALRSANAPAERCRGLAELAARWTDARLGRGAAFAARLDDRPHGDSRVARTTPNDQGTVGTPHGDFRLTGPREAREATPPAGQLEPDAAALGPEADCSVGAEHSTDCQPCPQHITDLSPGVAPGAGCSAGAACREELRVGSCHIRPSAEPAQARSTESRPADAARGALPAHGRRSAQSLVAGAAVAASRSAAPRRADSGPAGRYSSESRSAGPPLGPTTARQTPVREVGCARKGGDEDARWAGLADQALDAVRQAATMRRPKLWRFAWASPWIGRGRAQVIAINVLLPFAFAAGVPEGADVFERLAGEPANRVVRYMAELLAVPGVRFRGALHQQGLLQLFKDTCAERICERCPARGMDLWSLPREMWP